MLFDDVSIVNNNRILAEISDVVKGQILITNDHLQKLQYMEQVITKHYFNVSLCSQESSKFLSCYK